jgi:hypothetical protein
MTAEEGDDYAEEGRGCVPGSMTAEECDDYAKEDEAEIDLAAHLTF